MRKVFSLFALLVSLFSAIALADEGDVLLTPDEAKALIAAHETLNTSNTSWGAVTLDFKADGKLYGANSSGRDSGKWRIDADTAGHAALCLEWRRWDYTGCGLLKKSADGKMLKHYWSNGGLHFTANIG